MITLQTVKTIALSFPETEEYLHWGRPAFRIKKKNIFCTLWPKEQRAVLKLSEIDQSVFSGGVKKIFWPVPGGWGRKGWTYVDLKKVSKGMFTDALQCSWNEVAPEKLKKKVA